MNINHNIYIKDIKSLSNHELEKTLKTKAATERQLTVEIISLLEEVNSRRLYLQRGHGSLIEYCIKELNYSESSAYRRISAMRVAQEVPQVKKALAEGRINLVNVARAQTLFQKEAKYKNALSCVEKSKVLETLENQSSRQAEKILLQRSFQCSPELSQQPLPSEKIREISPTHTQVTLVFSEELLQKLSELKLLLSHKNPNPSTSELIEHLADMALKKLKAFDTPAMSVSTKAVVMTAAPTRLVATTAVPTNLPTVKARTIARSSTSGGASGAGGTSQKFKREYISTTLRRRTWKKASGRCQHQGSQNRCGSQFQLQIEHKNPVAKGGQNTEDNLELLCAAHNRLRAIEKFGKSHMQKYF